MSIYNTTLQYHSNTVTENNTFLTDFFSLKMQIISKHLAADRQTDRQTRLVTVAVLLQTGALRKLSGPVDCVVILDFARSDAPN